MNTDIYQLIVENMTNLIWMSDLDMKCCFFNKSWLAYTGRVFSPDEGEKWLQGIHPEDSFRCRQVYKDSFEKRRPFKLEYRLKRFDGEYRWMSDIGSPIYNNFGEFIGYMGCCQDVHDYIFKCLEDGEQAGDKLTELCSKPSFLKMLDQEIDRNHHDGKLLTLAFVDVDSFQKINDQFGNRAGDVVLIKVAEVIRGSVRSADTAARFSGDQFVILLRDVDEVSANTIINRIQEEISSLEFNFEGTRGHISASIGVAELNGDMSLETFVSAARENMEQKKRRRKTR